MKYYRLEKRMSADLHLHTIKSDGALTPKALVNCAKALQINTIAITDHDNVDGIKEGIAAGIEGGVKVIPGIELSSFSEGEVHILGYNISYEDKGFLDELKNIQSRRENRNIEIVKKLREDNIIIDYDKLKKNKPGSLGRVHIAIQMRDKGYVASVNEAFEKYIGFGCPYYEFSPLIKPAEAIKLILKYGGVPVLAHPYRYVEEKTLREFIESLPGLMGIEAYYPLHTESIRKEVIEIADEYGLIVTGGSDYHSNISGSPIGSANYLMNEKAREVLLK